MRADALRAGQFFVTNRWLGGTLTNFQSVKGSIDRLHAIEKMSTDGTYERMTKKRSSASRASRRSWRRRWAASRA
jgi:small subunit ribosomal protein S2